ncbi:hypothetical protein DB34_05570 [Acetobacter pasteurianus]|nr:hypothetical protein DB34_05570 [Acetobacter pasteurianus]
MSEELKPCRSYQPDGHVCKDGFFQRPLCRGNFGCHACGRTSEKDTPLCQYDELPSHFVTESGMPAFSARNTRAGEKA